MRPPISSEMDMIVDRLIADRQELVAAGVWELSKFVRAEEARRASERAKLRPGLALVHRQDEVRA
jgi:hypothetical protein